MNAKYVSYYSALYNTTGQLRIKPKVRFMWQVCDKIPFQHLVCSSGLSACSSRVGALGGSSLPVHLIRHMAHPDGRVKWTIGDSCKKLEGGFSSSTQHVGLAMLASQVGCPGPRSVWHGPPHSTRCSGRLYDIHPGELGALA